MDFTINGKPLNTLRVVDLKVELEKRGLPKSGNKNDLVGRLTQYFIRQQGQPQAQNETATYPQGTTIRQDMAGGVQPPNMSLSHGLTDNDFVRDYLKLRETQFASALSDQDAHMHASRMHQPSIQPLSDSKNKSELASSAAQAMEQQGAPFQRMHDLSQVQTMHGIPQLPLPISANQHQIPAQELTGQHTGINTQLQTAIDSTKRTGNLVPIVCFSSGHQ